MGDYIQLVTVLASGVFGLLVAVVTVALTWHKESRTAGRVATREKRAQLEVLYVQHIAIFEKCIRYTHSREPFRELYDELSQANARMRLLSTIEVIKEVEAAGDLLDQWSREQCAGMPKPIGDTGASIISSHDSPHQKRAKELFPQLHDQINKMIETMQKHLAAIDA